MQRLMEILECTDIGNQPAQFKVSVECQMVEDELCEESLPDESSFKDSKVQEFGKLTNCFFWLSPKVLYRDAETFAHHGHSWLHGCCCSFHQQPAVKVK